MEAIEVMRDPGHWPLRVLPVKKEEPGEAFDTGYLQAERGRVEPVIHFPSGGQARFCSFEDMVAAGWGPD